MSEFKRGDLVIRAISSNLDLAIVESKGKTNYRLVPIVLNPKAEWQDYMLKLEKLQGTKPLNINNWKVPMYRGTPSTYRYKYKGNKYAMGDVVPILETINLPHSNPIKLRKYSKEFLTQEELDFYNKAINLMNK
jgi:hypothetical protein